MRTTALRSARVAVVALAAASLAAACSSSPMEPRVAAAPSKARVTTVAEQGGQVSADSAGARTPSGGGGEAQGPVMPWF